MFKLGHALTKLHQVCTRCVGYIFRSYFIALFSAFGGWLCG